MADVTEPTVDLDAYFSRIGYLGGRTPTLETLDYEVNKQLAVNMRGVHSLRGELGDVASASLLENWIDETERRVWFLFETSRQGERPRLGRM